MKKIAWASVTASVLLMGADTAAETELKTHTELSYINTKGNTKIESFALFATGRFFITPISAEYFTSV